MGFGLFFDKDASKIQIEDVPGFHIGFTYPYITWDDDKSVYLCAGHIFERNLLGPSFIYYEDSESIIRQIEEFRNAKRYNRDTAMREMFGILSAITDICGLYASLNILDVIKLKFVDVPHLSEDASFLVRWKQDSGNGYGMLECGWDDRFKAPLPYGAGGGRDY